MNREVLLFAEDIIVDNRPLVSSGQGQVFFGTCPRKKERIVIKQINIQNNPEALIKELQVFQLFVRKQAEVEGEENQKSNTDLTKFFKQSILRPDLFTCAQGVPRILAFAHTDKIAELKMEFCGECVQNFMDSKKYLSLSAYNKSCIVFDMMRQIIWPLSQIHQAGFVHGDIKPENICMRPWPAGPQLKTSQNYQSEYEFTLIDFGIMSKFKLKKTNKIYSHHIGNLMFSSVRGLKCRQTRFQDDIESLIYLVYYFIQGVLPWDIDYSNQVKNLRLSFQEQVSLYKKIRLKNQQKYSQMIPNIFEDMIGSQDDLVARFKPEGTLRDFDNPFCKVFEFLNQTNLVQKSKLIDYNDQQQKLLVLSNQKEDPDKNFAEKQQFVKFEKLFEREFQLSYTTLEQILDWPNGYVTLQTTQGKTPHQNSFKGLHFKSNQKVVLNSVKVGRRRSCHQSFSNASLILSAEISNIKSTIQIKMIQDYQKSQILDSARNHIPNIFNSGKSKLSSFCSKISSGNSKTEDEAILAKEQQPIHFSSFSIVSNGSDSQQQTPLQESLKLQIKYDKKIASEHLLNRDSSQYDLDLTRFDTDEQVSIGDIKQVNVHVNNLKAIKPKPKQKTFIFQ